MKKQIHAFTALALCALAGYAAADNDFVGLRFLQETPSSPDLIAGGLGWQATLARSGVRLGRRAHVCFEEGGHGADGSWAGYFHADWADTGLIGPDAQLDIRDIDSKWASVRAECAYEENGKEHSFSVYVTRLSPAVVVEFTGERLRIFAGARIGGYSKADNEWSPPELKLTAPPPVPKYFAYPDGEETLVQELAMLEDLVAVGDEAIDGGWMLAWYGDMSRIRADADIGNRTIAADCPVLIVWSVAPRALEGGPDGVVMEFGGGMKRLAFFPLLGERLPRAVPGEQPKKWSGGSLANHSFPFAELPESELWARSFPPELAEQCRWWSERLAEVPMDAAETHTYDEAADILSVEGRVEFLKIADSGARLAPLPPGLALALRQKAPFLSVSGEPIDTGLTTKWGPYYGFDNSDSYAYTVNGLGAYAFQARTISAEAVEPAEVRAEFEAQLEKVLQAGVMAPWFPILSVGGYGPVDFPGRASHDGQRLLWGNPAENLYYITQCMEVAAPAQKERLARLAEQWQEKYPGEATIHMPAEADARREQYPPTILQIGKEWPNKEKNFHFLNKILPCESVYYMAEYYRQTGREPTEELLEIMAPYLARSDWASLGLLRGDKTLHRGERQGKKGAIVSNDPDYGRGGVDDINRLFAGCVGHIRVAKALGNKPEIERGMYFLARAAALRYDMEQWKYWLHDAKLMGLRPADAPVRSFYGAGLHTFARASPDDDPLIVGDMDEFTTRLREAYLHVHWKPNRLIAYRNMTPELGRFMRDTLQPQVAAYTRVVEQSNPEWYTPYADCTIAFETYCLHPEDSYQVFLARAWAAGDAPETLWKYADLPWVSTGDWYYIHKLAETIKAYRGVAWDKP